MKTLKQIIVDGVANNEQWGIWAELIDGEVCPDSPARVGQVQFDNGGVADGMIYVENGATAGTLISAQNAEYMEWYTVVNGLSHEEAEDYIDDLYIDDMATQVASTLSDMANIKGNHGRP